MALVLADRVLETTSVLGTGTVTLLGAQSGYQSFSVVGNGNTTYYTIADNTNFAWEVGVGTYNSGTLTRDTVLSSSNGGALVNFVSGTKNIFLGMPSERIYPPAGIPNSNGTSWGTSYGVTGIGSVILDHNPAFATDITVNGLTVGLGSNPAGNNVAIGNNTQSFIGSLSTDNISLGNNTQTSLTVGIGNVSIGNNSLSAVTTGNNNIGIGASTLTSNLIGSSNIAIGANALATVNSSFNICVGSSAMTGTVTNSINFGNYSASGAITDSVVFGNYAGQSSTLTNQAVLIGTEACRTSTLVNVGTIAIGYQAARLSKKLMTSVGYQACLLTNNRGDNSTAVGYQALYNNGANAITSSSFSANQCAFGHKALYANTTGSQNTAVGFQAGWGAAGVNANTTGSNNVYVGASTVGSASTNSYEAVIGSNLTGNGSNSTTVGGVFYSTLYTVATLPTASVGGRSFVTDASAPVFGTAVTGGGAVAVPVYYDGTQWRVG
jgi:hypothetical protein